jgi:putative FmdB family regulatory protein
MRTMPKYDFQCNACNIVQELLLAITETDTIPSCTLCGTEMKRVFTPPAILFKGAGFYKTGG